MHMAQAVQSFTASTCAESQQVWIVSAEKSRFPYLNNMHCKRPRFILFSFIISSNVWRCSNTIQVHERAIHKYCIVEVVQMKRTPLKRHFHVAQLANLRMGFKKERSKNKNVKHILKVAQIACCFYQNQVNARLIRSMRANRWKNLNLLKFGFSPLENIFADFKAVEIWISKTCNKIFWFSPTHIFFINLYQSCAL